MSQLPLFAEANPIRSRFEPGFFKQIPTSPGIYWMLDQNSRVLYVGKAKNLRSRLRSYRATTREKLAPKIWQLLLRTYEIHWETAESEEAALLLENRCLRSLKPPFNVANTRPETYVYIAHALNDEELELRLMFNLNSSQPNLCVHGAFKGIARATRSFASLARWTWAELFSNTAWPHPLAKNTAPSRVLIPLHDQAARARAEELRLEIEFFLDGIVPLRETCLPEDHPSSFAQWAWRGDQVRLKEFFDKSAKRLRDLKARVGHDDALVSQNQVDDLLTVNRLASLKADL